MSVEAWYLPASAGLPTAPAPLVVFAHGNGELIDWWPDMLQPYLDLGLSVLLPEYRGYGRSNGAPSERSIVRDALAFLERAEARPEVDASRIVFHGRSIGGGIVCSLAKHRRPAALVLWSTFTDAAAVASRLGVPGWLVPDRMDNLAVLSRLDVPTFIVHGSCDLLIPVAHAQRLHRAAARSELCLYDSDHNDCPPIGCDHWDRLGRWLGAHDLVAPRRGSASPS